MADDWKLEAGDCSSCVHLLDFPQPLPGTVWNDREKEIDNLCENKTTNHTCSVRKHIQPVSITIYIRLQ